MSHGSVVGHIRHPSSVWRVAVPCLGPAARGAGGDSDGHKGSVHTPTHDQSPHTPVHGVHAGFEFFEQGGEAAPGFGLQGPANSMECNKDKQRDMPRASAGTPTVSATCNISEDGAPRRLLLAKPWASALR